jgi:hypothetical protein
MVLFCGAVIFALELWRRYLARAGKLPRWASFAILGGYAITAGGVAFSYHMLHRAFDAVAESDAGNKASMLANGISHAMTGNAIAIAGILTSAILLCVFAARPKAQ